MGNQPKRIAVYGSAGSMPGSQDYENAYLVGKTLAEAGYTVLTGGYSGVMDAASKGAHDAGGRVIGVTVGLFRDRGLVPTPFLHEEIHLPTLTERLIYLVTEPDAYVIMRGGIGTLAELTLAWSLMQVREIPQRPLVLVGEQWTKFAPHFAQISTIEPRDLRYLTLVEYPEDVVPAINQWWENPPQISPRIGDQTIQVPKP